MALAHSTLTSQAQVSVPAGVARQTSIGRCSVSACHKTDQSTLHPVARATTQQATRRLPGQRPCGRTFRHTEASLLNDTYVAQTVLFPDLFDRPLATTFDQAHSSSESGSFLLIAADRALGLTTQLARALPDPRPAARVTHAWSDLLARRISGSPQGIRMRMTPTAWPMIRQRRCRPTGRDGSSTSDNEDSVTLADALRLVAQTNTALQFLMREAIWCTDPSRKCSTITCDLVKWVTSKMTYEEIFP